MAKSSITSVVASGGAGLKAKSSSKLKGKVKTVHDLSQKVKKKYSKSSKSMKTSVAKAVQSSVKTVS